MLCQNVGLANGQWFICHYWRRLCYCCIFRLLAYDRNDNFGTSTFVSTVAELVWPKFGFQKLTPESVPPMTASFIKAYFIKHGRKDGTRPVKSLDKGREMLDGMCVKACSVLQMDPVYYFTGMVRASMKRHVNYWCRMSCSDRGEIVNTECDCPAGTGPHAACKHLACMALMLRKCVHSQAIMMDKACTETLQTFHQPTRKSAGKYMMTYKTPKVLFMPSILNFRHCSNRW